MSHLINVTTVVGNPRRLSRTLSVAETLAGAIADDLDTPWDAPGVDLAELYRDGIEPGHDGLERASTNVAAADVLVVGTPVYKGTYTGLLKLFLDQLPPRALAGAIAVPVTVAGSTAHRLLADLHLRPVLAELGARLPVESLVLEESEYGRLPDLVRAWSDRNLAHLAGALGVSRPTAAVRA